MTTKPVLVFSVYLVLSVLVLVSPPPGRAQSPSPSATAGAQQIRDAVKEKVQQELDQIKKAVAKRAYVGTVSAKTDATLTITNLKNQSRTANVTGETTIKLTGGKEGTAADVKVSSFVIAIGDVDSQGVMTANRLLVITKPEEDKRRIFFGTVAKVTSSAITINTLKDQTLTVRVISSTKFTAKTKLADLKAGNKIIVVGTLGTADTVTAFLVHHIPPK